jgi:hypothetical protein
MQRSLAWVPPHEGTSLCNYPLSLSATGAVMSGKTTPNTNPPANTQVAVMCGCPHMLTPR